MPLTLFLENIVQVCVPNTPFEYLDYRNHPDNDLPAIGARVIVPFRNKKSVGIVVGYADVSACPIEKLRCIDVCLDSESLISETQFQLYRWISRYYHVLLSDVLTQALPIRFRSGAAILEGHHRSDFLLPCGETPKKLNQEQTEAFNAIIADLNHYHCFLLQGITGSGKTEVYLQAVQAVLSQGKQVLILVPEIGLVPQLFDRFQRRFVDQPIALLHSSLNDTERWHAWCQARTGEASIIIGTRSAIFTPMPHLGLIIVDEEHDASFKQQESLRYSARDTAIVRAQMQKIPIVLGTATPSLETLHNAANKKYTRLRLTQRAGDATAPMIQLIDLRQQKITHGISVALLESIKLHLQKKEQILIFVNRRGYAPVLLCHACRYMAQCLHCSARMTVHAKKKYLQCHHCDAQQAIPAHCPQCKQESIVFVGVGTERLEEYLQKNFPEARISRIDRDTTQRKNALSEKLMQVNNAEVDIVIGTQMLAKGHHFPHLTLAVILDVDQGFCSHDFRAAERIGQLILQVAGRAGREQKAGLVMIQTYVPDNPLLVTLLRDGYTPFSKMLLNERQETQFPPFAHIALFRCQSKDPEKARVLLNIIKQVLLHLEDDTLLILGPAPSPLEKKAGMYRFQLLLTAEERSALARAVHCVRHHKKITQQRLRFSVDIDPLDLS